MVSLRLVPLAVLAFAGCAQVDSPNPEIVLPDDYRTTFVEARSCRSTLEHASEVGAGAESAVVIKVRPEMADLFEAGGPFPEGALIIKEQYRDLQCTVANLVSYTAMKKQKAGYDPAGGDWSWYRMDERSHVLLSGKIATCITCHAVCGKTRDRTCVDP
jgi:hypothetical protein